MNYCIICKIVLPQRELKQKREKDAWLGFSEDAQQQWSELRAVLLLIIWILHTWPKTTKLDYSGSGIRTRQLFCLRTLWIRAACWGKAVKNSEHCCSLRGFFFSAILFCLKANQGKLSEMRYKLCCTGLSALFWTTPAKESLAKIAKILGDPK